MDIVVRGRNVEVPEHYRSLVGEKLARIERYDHKIISVDVELQHEKNRRQASACQHVEITCKSRGPVVRSEACAADFYAALDTAVAKLEARLRRAADRRRVHYGHHRPTSVAEAAPAPAEQMAPEPATADDDAAESGAADAPGNIVRRKRHQAVAMTVDQALYEMELVGHDFFLFADVDSGLPSVVYRRLGFAYGVISLAPGDAPTDGTGGGRAGRSAGDPGVAADCPERLATHTAATE